MKNFILLNDMMDFISGVFNEIEVKTLSFPLHIVLDEKGNCLAYLFGDFKNKISAQRLVDFLENLQ